MNIELHKNASIAITIVIAIVFIATVMMVLSSDSSVNLKMNFFGAAIDLQTKQLAD